jgi:hypothetical protein
MSCGGGTERPLTTFEHAFEQLERAADSAAKAAAAVLTASRQLKKAARQGDISGLRRSADRLALTLDALRQEAANARAAWPFGVDAEETYLKEGYESELVAAAQASGLNIAERDGRLLVFPSVVRILPAERTIRIDRRRVAGIRPSHVIAMLRANQLKKPRFAPERFLEAVFGAYRLVVGPGSIGSTVALTEVYEALTLLPGASMDYSPSDFARDLFILDRSGVTRTRSGAAYTLPASTGTKGSRGTLTFVAPDGELVTYFGIRFEASSA